MISLDTPEQWDVSLPIKDVQNSIAVDYHWEKKLIFFTDVNNDVIRYFTFAITKSLPFPQIMLKIF